MAVSRRVRRAGDASITGAKAGGILAIGYVIGSDFLFALGVVVSTFLFEQDPNWHELPNMIPFLLLVLLVGGIVGGIPASIIGAATAAVMAVIYEQTLPSSRSLQEIRRIGLAVCLSIVILVNIVVMSRYITLHVYPLIALGREGMDLDIMRLTLTKGLIVYLYFLGIPAGIFTITGWRLSPQIYKRTISLATRDSEQESNE